MSRAMLGFFRRFGSDPSQAPKFVCSDMWKPYLKVIANKSGAAIHILDRFHIMTQPSKAIDPAPRRREVSYWKLFSLAVSS